MPSFNRNTRAKQLGSVSAEIAISISYVNPSQIFLLGRTLSKVSWVIQAIHTLNPSIKTKLIHIDLASLSSVREAAAEINGDSEIERIYFIINNAGIIAVPTFEVSEDGVEKQFASNHIGHFLLTNLLINKLFEAENGARVLNVSSTGFELADVKFYDWNFQNGKSYRPWQAYAQTKTANVLFVVALAENLKCRGIQALLSSLGVCSLGNVRRVNESSGGKNLSRMMWGGADGFLGKMTKLDNPKTPREGCSTTLVAVLGRSIEGESGSFLQGCVVRPIEQEYVKGKENMDQLGAVSENLVGQRIDL